MNFQRIALAAIAALIGLALWLSWIWRPEQQIRRHTASLLRGVERRNWQTVEALIADKYTDRWTHDKAFVLSGLQQAFSDFLFLDVEHEISRADTVSGAAVARIRMTGQGGPVAQFVMSKVNGLGAPFTFTWEKSGNWPWDWQLISVDHPTLEPIRDLGF